MLILSIIMIVLGVLLFISAITTEDVLTLVIAVLLLIVGPFLMGGLFIVNPNEGRVIQLFGGYVGTDKQPGLRWVSPFCTRRRVSLRVRNFESGKLKVNDSAGNPIEIAAVVVWKVVDTAEAVFEVDDYENFVEVQSEAAVRNLATSYPYDAHEEGEIALRSHTNEIADHLKAEVQDRLARAGVEVIESRISHLAYAPEIAHAMLQRQQASAIIAARQKIVEGAVGMVEMALDQLSKQNVVELDEERKASMVSNLLVVLCSDRDTQPVVNTGSLYT
jgi:regulator of protease activity HflC (stomatin/prohibitin superfamily)